MKPSLRILLISIFLLSISCTKDSSQKTPSIVTDQKTKELAINSHLVASSDTVELVLEQTFESNEDVFLDGSLWRTLVDDRDQVIIVVQRLGKLGIYVFNQSGGVESIMGRYGRGPGEFESISSIAVTNDTLWVLDTRLQKISLFSLVDYKHIKDELLDKSLVVGEDKFTRLMKGSKLFTVNKDEVIVKNKVLSLFEPNMFTKSVYYRISEDGKILSPEILQQDRYTMYIFKERGSGREFGFTAPFTRTSLFTTNQKGDIYTAWSEDFRIQKHNSRGEYERDFYYDIGKSTLDLDKVDIYQERKKFIAEQGVPQTWPALHTIQADDEGRLWISTITDSDSTFKWFLIDGDSGDLKALFKFKGNRSEISPFVGQPFFEIKNGYFYTREYNYEEGIDRIVKYKIEFKERE
ncbi:MAG: 6-bladed beta-propeller [Balneola sp.]